MSELFKKASVLNLKQSVDYSEGGIVSKQVVKNNSGNLTLFSFDKGQGLSQHTAPFDAVVQILDGEAEVVLDGVPQLLKEGGTMIKPANSPQALNAVERFKMLLTMIKG